MSGAAVVLAALGVATAGVVLLRRHAAALPQAPPGERTLHDRPVPRVGGLAILAGALTGAVLDTPHLPGGGLAWLACVVAVALVSLADDLSAVPVLARLVVHLGASALLGWLTLGVAGAAVVAALAIAWGANLYNFMDGSDGMAAAMAVAGFSAYAVAAHNAGAPWAAYAAIAAATLPFLAVNRPPATLFMGDVGAVPLGFAAGALGVAGVAGGVWPAWFPPLAFLPFCADATLTLALRVIRGERFWQAHRSHYYQRLNLAGAGHRGTLAIYAAAMLACASTAVVCATLRPDAGWAALGVAALIHLLAFGAFDYHVRNKVRGSP